MCEFALIGSEVKIIVWKGESKVCWQFNAPHKVQFFIFFLQQNIESTYDSKKKIVNS